MADVSCDPREHWLKPRFSKNEVAKSGYITNPKEAIDEVLGRTLAFDLKRSNAILKTDLLPQQ